MTLKYRIAIRVKYPDGIPCHCEACTKRRLERAKVS